MPLPPGSRLGPYEIAGSIGAGGMGEVYHARDTKLGRDVAIKILPELFAADPDRLSRFEREARTLASLNHPNIAQIYGIEERALVMELVAGEDLAQRLARGPLPLDEALAVARQIAAALEAAHERGIIHRDLKPANIKVRDDGMVKVLDFGLAKAMEPDVALGGPDVSPTFTSPATQAGLILGTAAYMSPEQAKGRPIDKRADIWAFGVVFYEMLTGIRPFDGDSVSESLAAVLKSEPDWSPLETAAPAAVRRVIALCLEKDPRRRLRDIGDVSLLLDSASGPAAGSAGSPRASPRTHVLWLAACLATAAAGAWFARHAPAGPQMPMRRFDLRLPAAADADPLSAAISPDGSKVAYVASNRLWIHDLASLEPREVPGVSGVNRPFWSADSQWIAFGAGRRLWKTAAGGGVPVAIADLAEDFTPAAGGVWRADGRVIFTTGFTGLLEVSDRGGDVREVLPIDTERDLDFHEVVGLPGDRGVIFYVHARPGFSGGIEVFDWKTRKPVLREDGLVFDQPVYSPSGHILYRRSPSNAGIWALPFSLDRLETTGPPFLVRAGEGVPSVSLDGTLVVSRGGSGLGQPSRLTWLDRSGAVVAALGDPEPRLQFPALSPDDRRIAVGTADGVIWIYDAVTGARTRITLEPGLNIEPAWFPDGKRIAHTTRPSMQAGLPKIVARGVDGAGPATPLAESGDAPAISADGHHLVYSTYGGRPDLMHVDLRKPGTPRPIVGDPAVSERQPALSPDGRWLAFAGDGTGRDEIYVTSFPDAQRRWQVTSGGGGSPRWRSDSRELFYLSGEAIMSVSVAAADPGFAHGSPAKLFEANRISAGFAVSRDGRRFLTVRSDETKETRPVTVVQNWFAEFQQR